MGQVGLLGVTINGYGCANAGYVSYGLVTREVERVDSGFRSAMSVQSSLVMHAINTFGTKDQKDRWLEKLRRGELVGAFGLTEPNHGSDPASMTTSAREHPSKTGVYLLNGSKTWITNAPIADLFVVWAKLSDTQEIRGFVLERSPNLQTPPLKHKHGLRASVTGMIQMDDVEVPAENMFSVTGLKGPFTCLNSARYGIAWGVMGALEDCLTRARDYSLEREQFGSPIAKYQLVQKKFVDALTDLNYGLLAAIQVGRLKNAGQDVPEMTSMIKRHNTERALAAARSLQEVFGGNAVSDEYHIGRHVANLFVTTVYEGSSDIHALILGRAFTGIPAFT